MSEALAREGDISSSSNWTVGTLRDYFLGLIGAHDRRMTEEVSHLKDLHRLADRAIEVAFAAQQRAIDTAFTAQQTGLNAALLAQKEAIATALVAAEKAVNAALVSSAQAVQKAEMAAERRFESVNEFRGTLADQQRLLMPRAEVEVLMRSLSEKIDSMTTESRERNSKAAGISAGWAMAIGVVGLITLLMGIATFFIRTPK